jgi:hypothetical protein
MPHLRDIPVGDPNEFAIYLTFNKNERAAIMGNSLERMINTSLRLASECLDHAEEEIRDKADISVADWQALRPLVLKIWLAAQNTVRQRAYNQMLVDRSTNLAQTKESPTGG